MKRTRRLLSVLLALALMAGVLGVAGYADGQDDQTGATGSQQEGPKEPGDPDGGENSEQEEEGGSEDGEEGEDEEEPDTPLFAPMSGSLFSYTNVEITVAAPGDAAAVTAAINAALADYSLTAGQVKEATVQGVQLDASGTQMLRDTLNALEILHMPDQLVIPEAGFNKYTSLREINMPAVTEISYWGFYDCANLESIHLPAVTTVNQQAFIGCTSLVSVYLPEATTVANAFPDCTSLEYVDLPKAKTIAQYCFSGCINLKNVTLPSIETITDNVFAGCTSLTTLTLPDTIQDIRANAFTGSSLTDLVIQSDTPPTLEFQIVSGWGIFGAPASQVASTVRIWVPEGSKAAYITALADHVDDPTAQINPTGSTGITLSSGSVNLKPGETVTLTVTVQPADFSTVVVWDSDNPAVATVDPSGLVTAVAEGTAVITATSAVNPSASASCTVYVDSAPVPGGSVSSGATATSGSRSSGSGGTTAAPSTARRTVTPQHLGGYSWRVDLPVLGFVEASVDGDTLTRGEEYMVHSGSTILTLADSYVNSLRPGSHILRMEFLSATATIDFTVTPTGTGSGDMDEPNAPALTSGGNDNMNPSTGADPALLPLPNHAPGPGFPRSCGIVLAVLLAILSLWAAVPRETDDAAGR